MSRRVPQTVFLAEKTCQTCNQTKPIEQFHRCISRADGAVQHCKACANSRAKPRPPERNRLNSRTQREKNRERYRERHRKYMAARRQTDEFFRFTARVRQFIRASFKRQDTAKSKRSEEILGCTIEELKFHLICTAILNYGDWSEHEAYHIDHIYPLAGADTQEDVIQLCHYSNLQLLKPTDNLSKSDRIP